MRIFDNEDTVKCNVTGRPLPDNQESRYKYIVSPAGLDEQIHIERAQAALIEYFHGHWHCETAANVEKLVLSVPHRVTGTRLESEANAVGFGIHAQQGFNLCKAVTLLAITQAGPIAFAAWYLISFNRYDLQNALMPAMYILALVGLLVAVPDIYFR